MPIRRARRNLFPFRLVVAAIFALAFLVRVLHAWQLHSTPVFDMRVGDSAVYDAWAREIAGGDWIGHGVFWYAPLYPYVLGSIYAVFGDGGWGVRLIQAAVGSLSCVLLADAGRRLFSTTAGVAAGVLLALYAPAIFYDALIHRPVLELFLMSVVVWIVSARAGRQVTPRWALALGGAAGLLVLSRENALSLAPVLLLWLVLDPPTARGGRFVPALAFLLGLSLALTPVALRNRVVGGELHLTAANFGDNFYKGNNERSDGWYVPLRPLRGSPEFERTDATAIAQHELGRALTPAEVSRYWTGRAFEYIRSHPLDWLRLLAQKLFLVWHAVELGDAEDLYTHASWSDALRLTMRIFHFGTLAPLALLGIWATWDRRRTLRPLHWMLAVYPLSVVLFYVFGRYRYAIVAILVLFAGAAIVESASFLRASSAGKRCACALSVAGALVVCNWPTDSEERVRAATLYNIGVWLGRQPNRSSEAIGYYEQSLRLRPDSAEVLYNLGNALKRSGDLAGAEARYRRAIALEPDLAGAHSNLGECLEARGLRTEAIESYRRAIEVDPGNWEAHSNLGLALERDGRVGEAAAALVTAIRIRPDSAPLHYNLGNVLIEDGRLEDAVAEYRRSLELDAQDPRTHNNLGYALAALGRLEEAAFECSEALRLDPGYAAARTNLASIEAARRSARRGRR